MKRDIFLLLEEIRFRKGGLRTESIADLEVDYVKKKRKLKNSELELEIEKTLIDMRKGTNSPLDLLNRTFLERALLLPLEPCPIRESLPQMLKRFREDSFFWNFSQGLRDQLEQVISTTFYAASAPGDSALPLREVCYCGGNPASGKSSAMKRLAENILKVPCYEVTVRDGSDLSRENLEGVDRYRFNAEVGWLVTPLLTREPNTKQTYSNAFLIINDFDRILFNPSRGPAALNFLLDYLDPRKRSVRHPYFRAMIDISRLNIIITANKKLPSASEETPQKKGLLARLRSGDASKKAALPDDTFAALRSRVRVIDFPDFDAKNRKSILDVYVKEACTLSKISPYLQVTLQEAGWRVTVDEQFPGRHHVGQLPRIDIMPQCANLREAERDIRSAITLWGAQLSLAAQNCIQESRRAVGRGKLSHLRLAVLCGDMQDAPYQMASVYRAERDGTRDAIFWAEMASKYGNATADYLLGEIFSTLGEHYDSDRAVASMRQAAVKKHAGARFWLAQWYRRGGELAQARDYLLTLLREEDVRGAHYSRYLDELHRLGEEFEHKQGISLSNEQALQCFQEASSRNHARSQFKLGWLNFHSEKFKEASDLFEKSSALSDVYARSYLGLMHLLGIGMKKDKEKGEKLLSEVSTIFMVFSDEGRGWEVSNLARQLNSIIREYRSYQQTNGEHASFREYFRTHRENQYFGMDGDVCMIIAHMYYFGKDFEQDTSTAKEWYKRSKDLKNLLGIRGLEQTTSCIIM